MYKNAIYENFNKIKNPMWFAFNKTIKIFMVSGDINKSGSVRQVKILN